MEKKASRFPLLLSFFLVFFSFPYLSSSVKTIPISLDEPSAYKELKNWGFPIGLLPANVKDYSLNRTTGEFSVSLGDQCQITLPPDNYVATYKRTVTGRVAEGKIGQLDGIEVWAIFKWWSITGIKASGENLVFEVGMVSAKFPTKNFDESPVCEGTSSASR
ncbi:uncharacterized protein LOC116256743 [Nymphaea colorata]|nr:uncharacterized protein LOC116256743 [Nymphaea colorata]